MNPHETPQPIILPPPHQIHQYKHRRPHRWKYPRHAKRPPRKPFTRT